MKKKKKRLQLNVTGFLVKKNPVAKLDVVIINNNI